MDRKDLSLPAVPANRLARRRSALRGQIIIYTGLVAHATAASVQRIFDVIVALALLALTGPFLILLCLTRILRLQRRPRIGRHGSVFREWTVSGTSSALARLPACINILKGEMSVVGPKPRTPSRLELQDSLARQRYATRPGLVCLWWIRERANIAFDGESHADAEYAASRTWRGDLGILARAGLAACYGKPGTPSLRTRPSILGIPIDNLTMETAINRIAEAASSTNGTPQRICFVNADCGNLSRTDRTYRSALRAADLVLADGIGIKLAGTILKSDIRENVNGTDLFPRLCRRLAESDTRVFLLGGKPGVAEDVADWAKRQTPGLSIVGTHNGYLPPEETHEVCRMIKDTRADILFVAMGAPRQDLWIQEHLESTGVRVAAGVGGLFDFYSGRMPRAPQWVRELGLEWAYRLAQEPGRLWRRYLVGNGLFLSRVVLQKLGKRYD